MCTVVEAASGRCRGPLKRVMYEDDEQVARVVSPAAAAAAAGT